MENDAKQKEMLTEHDNAYSHAFPSLAMEHSILRRMSGFNAMKSHI